ncbi:hypothetical protein E0485_14740 [Paenibacillus albiflavus]|uniref:Uncharacterized protein n=1 Tax=Paenibacillus albiflavus TaxID=2545760 RepID=A0A4R4EA41_9BACL|nr:hypothetical protein [Paenibacillus albiflavus]TCZ76097.1 hypothetical protein E0485_14740 [Paenibacillus albiflavus]
MERVFRLDSLTIDKAITMPMFLVIIIFILLIGTLFSLGTLRLFQQRKRFGFICFGGGIISLAAFIFIASFWVI